MEIVQILPTIFGFKDCKCSECGYRFGCWTSKSSCCPLKMVRLVVVTYLENPRYNGIKFEVNNNLGNLDKDLLTMIGEDLLRQYENKQKN